MIRRMIEIDEALCNGCGACANACHEGAIAMVNGKAKLISDEYCDGLGDCLPTCPTGAIAFVEREAAAYDAIAVAERMAAKKAAHGGCPGSAARAIEREETQSEPLPCGCPGSHSRAIEREATPQQGANAPVPSRLRQWPVQIKLVPVTAPYFDGADLLIAADCSAYACGDFHSRYLKNRITLIGCPKLDEGDYAEKLTEIIARNNIKSVTVVRMQVPCCGGLEHAVKRALQASGKFLPWQVVTISASGEEV